MSEIKVKPITCDVLLLSEEIIRDVVSNNISIINVIEEFRVFSYPFQKSKVKVAILLCRNDKSTESNRVELDLKFLNNGKQIAVTPFKVNFEGSLKHRVIMEIEGLLIPEEGHLELVLNFKGEVLRSYKIMLVSLAKKQLENAKS